MKALVFLMLATFAVALVSSSGLTERDQLERAERAEEMCEAIACKCPDDVKEPNEKDCQCGIVVAECPKEKERHQLERAERAEEMCEVIACKCPDDVKEPNEKDCECGIVVMKCPPKE